MEFDKLGFMVKRASLTNGFKMLPEPSTELFSLPKISEPKMAEIPKTPKLTTPKLTKLKGKSKPAFTHEFKTNSPYNLT